MSEEKPLETLPLPDIEAVQPPIPLYAPPRTTVYIPDTYNHRIQLFDQDGNFLSTFGSYGRGEGYLRMPTDVLQKNTSIYILDKGNNRIQVFDLNHTFLFSFGNSELTFPLGFDIYGDKVYVANTYKSRIDVFSLDGQREFSFGTKGRGDGQFRYVSDLAVDDDYVYALDTDNQRIQLFTHNGTFIRAWGKLGPYLLKDTGVKFPLGIEIYNHTLYVADTQNSEIKLYTPNGTLLQRFGTYGKGEEQFRFESKIWEINDKLYIADSKNSRIKIYYPNGTLYSLFGNFGRGEGQFRAPGVIRVVNYNIINKTNSTP